MDNDLPKVWSKEAQRAGIHEAVPNEGKGLVYSPSYGDSFSSAVAHVSEKNAVFRRHDLLLAYLARRMGRFDSSTVQQEFDQLCSARLVSMGKELFSTPQQVEIEKEILRVANHGKEACSPFFRYPGALRDFLASKNTITEDITKKFVWLVKNKLGFVEPSTQEAVERYLTDFLEQKTVRPTQDDLHSMRTGIAEIATEGKQNKAWIKSKLIETIGPLERNIQGLTNGQSEAIEKTLLSKDEIILWQGVAGAGKTTSVRSLVEILKDQGIGILGLGQSASAAATLSKEAQIPSKTLKHFLVEFGDSVSSPSQKVVVLDEASLVSSKDMHDYLKIAKKHNLRTIVIGDVAQLSPIEAGTPFADLVAQSKTTLVELSESVRQRNPLLRSVVKSIYERRFDHALNLLEKNVVVRKNQESRVDVAAQRYLKLDPKEREETLLLSKTNKEREQITDKIREELKKDGSITESRVVKTLIPIDVPTKERTLLEHYEPSMSLVFSHGLKGQVQNSRNTAFEIDRVDIANGTLTLKRPDGERFEVRAQQLKDSQLYFEKELEIGIGDRVVATKNKRDVRLQNNDILSVEGFSGNKAVLRRKDGTAVELSLEEKQHLTHAWCLTIHRSQGLTAKNTIAVLGSSTAAPEFVVAMTRSQNSLTLVTHDVDDLKRSISQNGNKRSALEMGQEVLEANQNAETMQNSDIRQKKLETQSLPGVTTISKQRGIENARQS